MKFILQMRDQIPVKVYWQGGCQPASADEQELLGVVEEGTRVIEALGEAVLMLAKKVKLTKDEAKGLENLYSQAVDFVEIKVRGQG